MIHAKELSPCCELVDIHPLTHSTPHVTVSLSGLRFTAVSTSPHGFGRFALQRAPRRPSAPRGGDGASRPFSERDWANPFCRMGLNKWERKQRHHHSPERIHPINRCLNVVFGSNDCQTASWSDFPFQSLRNPLLSVISSIHPQHRSRHQRGGREKTSPLLEGMSLSPPAVRLKIRTAVIQANSAKRF